MTEATVILLLVTGGAFALLAGVGLFRLPDVIIRMHASTKAGTLGTGLILVAVAVYHSDPTSILRAAATIAFLLITAPVSAQMIGRAAYRTGVPLSEHTRIDELRAARAAASSPIASNPSEPAGGDGTGSNDRIRAGGDL